MENKIENAMVVGSYSFDNEKEYTRAKQEKELITKLAKKLDLNDPEQVCEAYNSILEEKVFQTAIGMDYLIKLRTLIIKRQYLPASSVPAIPASMFRPDKADTFLLGEAQNKIDSINQARKKDKERFRSSLILNAILIIVIGVMMYIASTSDNINITNYETKILNKYSSWQQQLSEKEAYLIELERSLTNK